MGPVGYALVIFGTNGYLVVPSEWERVTEKDEESAKGLSPYPAIPVVAKFNSVGTRISL